MTPHDPLATAAACPACLAGAKGYDHDAVRARRPRDYSRQLEAYVRQVADGVTALLGVTLNPLAQRTARRWLVRKF
jgi:hypothetical protein